MGPAAPDAGADRGHPGADFTGLPDRLFGIPTVLSANGPQQITLIDAGNILYSDDGQVDVAISEQAAIQMNTTPTDPAVAATTFESLWQHNLWGVRVTRFVAWQRAQTGAVSYMVTTY